MRQQIVRTRWTSENEVDQLSKTHIFTRRVDHKWETMSESNMWTSCKVEDKKSWDLYQMQTTPFKLLLCTLIGPKGRVLQTISALQVTPFKYILTDIWTHSRYKGTHFLCLSTIFAFSPGDPIKGPNCAIFHQSPVGEMEVSDNENNSSGEWWLESEQLVAGGFYMEESRDVI